MMLQAWIADIARAVAAFQGPTPLGLGGPSDAELSGSVAAGGFPGVLPLWGGKRQVIGLLAQPEAGPREWRAVILRRGQGLTLATDARTVLPQFIVQQLVSNMPETAERLAAEWPGLEQRAFELHRVLGGSDEALQTAVSVLLDPDVRATFEYDEKRIAAFEEAHSAVFRRIDSSATFVRYADWLDSVIAGKWTPPGDPEHYGSWDRRVLCWAARLVSGQKPRQQLPLSVLQFVVEGDAGIDSGLPVVASWGVRVSAASGESSLVEAADLADAADDPADEITEGIVRALVSEGTAYKGLAHSEAVPAADEGGEPERAWHLLQSAAWWAARNTGAVPDAMLEGARFIAARHEWADVRWVVERGSGGKNT
jgi:hypothetical protein